MQVMICERPIRILPQYGFHDIVSPWQNLLVAHEADLDEIDPFDQKNQVRP